MSNKINTTTGNEVKDMNTTELEGKVSSSTSQSGGMSNAGKLLVLAIANLITMGLIVTGYALVVYSAAEGAAKESAKESAFMAIALVITAVFCAFLPALAKKWKKKSETSTKEQSAKVAKTKEVTGSEDEKPSNGFSNSAKFLLLAMGVLMTSVIIAFGFALLH